jgi:hypothetical protein
MTAGSLTLEIKGAVGLRRFPPSSRFERPLTSSAYRRAGTRSCPSCSDCSRSSPWSLFCCGCAKAERLNPGAIVPGVSTSDGRENTFRLRGGEAAYALTEQEAFLAMSMFIAQFASTGGDDLLTLAADISFEADGETLDPAAWHDWIECIRAVKGDPPEGDTWRALGVPRIERQDPPGAD